MSSTQTFNSCSKSLLEKWEIPVNHLDYAYVNECSDAKELSRIVRILRSGQEGHFPDLLRKAEQRLQVIDPANKLLREHVPVLTRNLDPIKWREINDEVQQWIDEIAHVDHDLQKTDARLVAHPPLRKITFTPQATRPKRIASTDYDAWNKYDPDVEEIKEKNLIQKVREKNVRSIDASARERFTQTERVILANRERERGNEYFKARDYREACVYYTNSVRLFPTVAALNNRALTFMKMNEPEKARGDCEQVLKLEPANVKGLLRMGQVLKELHDYERALGFFEAAIAADPSVTVARDMINSVKKKLGGRVRVKIQEERPMRKVYVPIPSTSKYKGPGVRVVHVPDDGLEMMGGAIRRRVSFNDDCGRGDEGNGSVLIEEVEENPEKWRGDLKKLMFIKEEEKSKDCDDCDGEPDTEERREEKEDSSGGCETLEELRGDFKSVELNEENLKDRNGAERDPVGVDESKELEDIGQVKSAYEFARLWNDSKMDLRRRGAILRRVDASMLADVITHIDMDWTTFSDLLKCLDQFTHVEPDNVQFLDTFMCQLSRMPRFEMIARFCDATDRARLANILCFLRVNGAEKCKGLLGNFDL